MKILSLKLAEQQESYNFPSDIRCREKRKGGNKREGGKEEGKKGGRRGGRKMGRRGEEGKKEAR